MEPSYIFLSYRSTEVDFALKLAADLKNAGVNLWMDRLDIRPGEDWRKTLEGAVYNCAAVIAILSPDYVGSKYCQRELARADRLGRPIFPILLNTLDLLEWPLEIERQQYIDFSGWRDDDLYRLRLDGLVSVLKERFAEHITVAPNPETQYLTQLAAELESQRGLIEYLENIGVSEDWAASDMLRPQPRASQAYLTYGNYALLHDGVARKTPGFPYPNHRQTRLRDIREMFAQHTRFVLLGAAGAGKTTTLRYLALEAVRARQAAPHHAPMPLLLDLVSWSGLIDPESFIRMHWPFDTDPIKLLARGEIALYLDGLSELGAASPEIAGRLRDWLKGDHAPQRVVLACRAEDYSADLNMDLPVVQIMPLKREQIRKFCINYLGEDAGELLLARILPRSEWNEKHKYHLSRLAHTIFLLSALTLTYRQLPNDDPPSNLGLLIRQLVAEIWQQKRHHIPADGPGLDEVEMALADLAFAMTSGGAPVYVAVDYALEFIGSESLLRAAVSADLLRTKDRSVRFAYQPLQDYFAALKLEREGLRKHLQKPNLDRGGLRQRSRWDMAVMLLAGLSTSPDNLLLNIAEVDPYLALECLASGVIVSEATSRLIIEQISRVQRAEGRDGRVATAAVLASMDPESALPILLEALRDGSWDVRRAAALVMWQLEMPALPGLTQALDKLEYDIRDPVTAALRQLGETALPTLLRLLADERWKLRRGAAWALGELRDRAAVASLVEALYDDDELVSAEAAQALGKMRDSAATPWLLEFLHHDNWRIRKAAAAALGAIGRPAVRGLLVALQSDNHDVCRLAVETLKSMDDPAIAPALLDATYHESAEVRAAALNALDGVKDAGSVKRLIEALTDTATTRWNRQRICDIAATVLEKIGTEQALQAVIRWRKGEPVATASPDEAPRRGRSSADEAKDRLQRIKQTENGETASPGVTQGRKILSELLEALRSPDWEARQRAAKALREYARTLHGIKDPEIVRALTAALADTAWEVRWASAEALAWIGDRTALPALLRLLHDSQWPVRVAAVRALLEIGDPNAIDGLVERLSDKQAAVREASAEALGAIGDPRGTPALSRAVGDDEAFVRLAAVIALGRIGGCDAEAPLLRALTDGDEHVSWAAAEALSRIASEPSAAALAAHLNDLRRPYWEDKTVSGFVVDALERLGTTEARALLTTWRQDHRATN